MNSQRFSILLLVFCCVCLVAACMLTNLDDVKAKWDSFKILLLATGLGIASTSFGWRDNKE